MPVRDVNYDRRANGLLLRGVVRATYVSNDPGHPLANNGANPPKAIYCDVLVYPSMAGQRWFGLTHVLVSQPTGGMHRGRIWKPRATTANLDKQELDQTSNPAAMDGDHVLIGFLNDSFDQPIILRGLPHPATDTGQAEGQNPVGRRMILVDGDYDPDFIKHHGVFRGVDNDGNFIVDTTWANDGKFQTDPSRLGHEADPPTDGKGSQTFRLPQDALYGIALFDMTDPSAPTEVMSFTIDKAKVVTKIAQNNCLWIEGDLAGAKLTLGDGVVKVAVADHLEALYGLLKTAYDSHKHPTGTGPSGTPDTPAPDWDASINSSQVLIPDTIP
ncbi:MAG: hypothetical protein A2Y61_00240 [Chloroflexi bacterium RBG_13_60_13]|nr:MAG: hypothetical protein A2Y61_00240 [Chloroflexi bacterium RBG_13_60_13]